MTYTGKASVEADGWAVTFTFQYSDDLGNYVTAPRSCGATGNYYGYSRGATVGHMTKVLSGSGTGVLTVGNCWDFGTVRVYKNGIAIGSADVVPAGADIAGTQIPVEFTYVDGDELTIQDEEANSVVLLTSLMLTPAPDTCVEETFKATLQDGEGYYIDPAYNGGEGLCRSVPAANVQAVRDAHANGNWIEGDHATARTYLPRGIFRSLPTCALFTTCS
jgi:hypothetical protein